MPSDEVRYDAAGGVVVDGGRVLVLNRPGRKEIRLPKGHVDEGEDFVTAAVREVAEESGYAARAIADLGSQLVEFDHAGRHWRRTEYFFLMERDHTTEPAEPEPQFEPMWTSWDDAARVLTFDREQEWVRRARRKLDGLADGSVV